MEEEELRRQTYFDRVSQAVGSDTNLHLAIEAATRALGGRSDVKRAVTIVEYPEGSGTDFQWPDPHKAEPHEFLRSESVIAFLGTLAVALQLVERDRSREGFEALFLRHLENLSKVPLQKLSPQTRIEFGRILASFHEVREHPGVAEFPDEPKMQ